MDSSQQEAEMQFDFEHPQPPVAPVAPPIDPNVRPVDVDMEGHGLVDMSEFNALQNRTLVFERNLSNINTNLTNLTTLVHHN